MSVRDSTVNADEWPRNIVYVFDESPGLTPHQLQLTHTLTTPHTRHTHDQQHDADRVRTRVCEWYVTFVCYGDKVQQQLNRWGT